MTGIAILLMIPVRILYLAVSNFEGFLVIHICALYFAINASQYDILFTCISKFAMSMIYIKMSLRNFYVNHAKLDLPIIFVANIKFRKYGERKENVPNT